MHIIVAFILGASLLAGYHPMFESPEDETRTVVNADQDLSVHAQMESLEEIKNKNLIHQRFDYSCGSAALATLLNYHLGENFTERQVISGMIQHSDPAKIRRRRAFSLLDMKKFVDVLGYHGQGYSAKTEDIADLDEPVILPIEVFGYEHFVVFKGFHGDRVFVADPWLGNTSYTRQDFEQIWTRKVIFMVDPKGRGSRNMLRLSKQDLRYVGEDRARQAFFPPHQPGMDPPFAREHKTIDPDRHVYKR